MQKFIGLVQSYLKDVREIMPWDGILTMVMIALPPGFLKAR